MRTFRLRTLLVGTIVATFGLALIAFDLSRSYGRDIGEAERAKQVQACVMRAQRACCGCATTASDST